VLYSQSYSQGFNACQAATLSPLFFFSPAILSRAALYTVGVVGSISYIGATAKYVFATLATSNGIINLSLETTNTSTLEHPYLLA